MFVMFVVVILEDSVCKIPQISQSHCMICMGWVAEGFWSQQDGNFKQPLDSLLHPSSPSFALIVSDVLFDIIKGSLVANFRYTNFWVAWQE